MATVTLPAAAPPPPPVVLSDMSWNFYEQFLTEIGDRHVAHSFVDGVLTIMSPAARHERSKKRLAQLVEALTDELDLPRNSLGSMTMKLDPTKRGAEPDECYLIANAHALDGREDDILGEDPPPDLVIEIDMTSPSLNRLPVYAALGVPEVWVYDGRSLTVKTLCGDVPETYVESETSTSFPTLPLTEFAGWIEKAHETDESTWIRAFRKWVRETMMP